MEEMTKYPSMMQTYHTKEIATWISYNPQINDEKFIVTEKIHGSNFQIQIERDTPIKMFSRESEVLVGHDLYNKALIALAEPAVAKAIEEVQAVADLMGYKFNLFGELFGQGIQKGINYNLGEGVKMFRVFDMMIEGLWQSQESFWSYPPIKHIRVPELAVGISLQEALDYNVEDGLTTFHPATDNIWEGVVIKPWKGVYKSPDGSLFHIKKKHPRFDEKRNEKLPRVIDSEVQTLNNVFLGYLNDNRVQSYFSKHGEIQNKTQIGEYVKGIVEDAKIDFYKDHGEIMAQLDPSKHKAALNIGGTVANLLKAYL